MGRMTGRSIPVAYLHRFGVTRKWLRQASWSFRGFGTILSTTTTTTTTTTTATTATSTSVSLSARPMAHNPFIEDRSGRRKDMARVQSHLLRDHR